MLRRMKSIWHRLKAHQKASRHLHLVFNWRRHFTASNKYHELGTTIITHSWSLWSSHNPCPTTTVITSAMVLWWFCLSTTSEWCMHKALSMQRSKSSQCFAIYQRSHITAQYNTSSASKSTTRKSVPASPLARTSSPPRFPNDSIYLMLPIIKLQLIWMGKYIWLTIGGRQNLPLSEHPRQLLGYWCMRQLQLGSISSLRLLLVASAIPGLSPAISSPQKEFSSISNQPLTFNFIFAAATLAAIFYSLATRSWIELLREPTTNLEVLMLCSWSTEVSHGNQECKVWLRSHSLKLNTSLVPKTPGK